MQSCKKCQKQLHCMDASSDSLQISNQYIFLNLMTSNFKVNLYNVESVSWLSSLSLVLHQLYSSDKYLEKPSKFFCHKHKLLKFGYFEKATKFEKIFVTFLKYLNFSSHGFYYSCVWWKVYLVSYFAFWIPMQCDRINKSCLLYFAAKQLQQQR